MINTRPGDKLAGRTPGPKKWYFNAVEYGIMGVQWLRLINHWRDVHNKIVIKQLPSGWWLVFEFTFPRAKFSRINEVPTGYKVYRDPDNKPYYPDCLFRAAQQFVGSPYDAAEYIPFLAGSRIIIGLKVAWYVCSTGVNAIMRMCGHYLWKALAAVYPGEIADKLVEVEQN